MYPRGGSWWREREEEKRERGGLREIVRQQTGTGREGGEKGEDPIQTIWEKEGRCWPTWTSSALAHQYSSCPRLANYIWQHFWKFFFFFFWFTRVLICLFVIIFILFFNETVDLIFFFFSLRLGFFVDASGQLDFYTDETLWIVWLQLSAVVILSRIIWVIYCACLMNNLVVIYFFLYMFIENKNTWYLSMVVGICHYRIKKNMHADAKQIFRIRKFVFN